MMTPALPTIALAALLSAGTTNGATDETPFVEAASTPPPGTILVKAGRIKMGTSQKEVEDILEMSKGFHGQVRLLDAETPQHAVALKGFAIGKFEATNEQYEVYIRSVGTKPPEHWAVEAISKAQRAFLESEGKKARDAREAGDRYTPKKWDEQTKEKWWSENWKDVEWGVPAGDEAKPVNFVDYEDVRGYCAWAGLRIPTEAEWVGAARGNSTQAFPWGKEWEAEGRAHTGELSQPRVKPVGSFPDGASPLGAMDMAGSVWEWTSSPYNAFPKYKPGTYKGKVGKDKFDLPVTSDFRSNHKVIKGGGFGAPLLAARVAFRQGTRLDQTAVELGFRYASSVTPGADLAAAAWRDSLRHCPVRQDEADLDFVNISGVDRWKTKAPAGERPEGYGIVESYDAVVFVPRGNLDLKPGGELDTKSRVWPVTMGAFITTVPTVEPALEPGSYLVMFRSKGKFLEDTSAGSKEEEETPEETPEEGEAAPEPAGPESGPWAGINTKENLLIFCNAETGEVAGTVEIKKQKDDRFQKVPATVSFESGEVIVGVGAERKKETQDWLSFAGRLPFAKGKRAVPLNFRVRLEAGTFGTGWRR